MTTPAALPPFSLWLGIVGLVCVVWTALAISELQARPRYKAFLDDQIRSLKEEAVAANLPAETLERKKMLVEEFRTRRACMDLVEAFGAPFRDNLSYMKYDKYLCDLFEPRRSASAGAAVEPTRSAAHAKAAVGMLASLVMLGSIVDPMFCFSSNLLVFTMMMLAGIAGTIGAVFFTRSEGGVMVVFSGAIAGLGAYLFLQGGQAVFSAGDFQPSDINPVGGTFVALAIGMFSMDVFSAVGAQFRLWLQTLKAPLAFGRDEKIENGGEPGQPENNGDMKPTPPTSASAPGRVGQ